MSPPVQNTNANTVALQDLNPSSAEAIVKGDTKCHAIAAASIIAKVGQGFVRVI